MELSFRTYGMISAFVTIAILIWFQVTVLDSPSGYLMAVLGISGGGVLFVIECLDFWRCARRPCARRLRWGRPTAGGSRHACLFFFFLTTACPTHASARFPGSAATASGATAAKSSRPRRLA